MKSRRPGDETRRWNLSEPLRPEYFKNSPSSPPRVTPLATLIHFPAFCWNFAYLILRGEKNLENGKWLEGDDEKKENGEGEVVVILYGSKLVTLRCFG